MFQNLKVIILLSLVLLLLPAEVLSQGQHSDKTITGELSGFDCAVVGVLCPTTHRGADYTTGVFTDDDEFYFVVNIPQSFLQQYFRETAEVEGTIYTPYERAVEPEIIHLIEDGEKRLVYESGYFIDENNQRATFQNGVFRNGKWIVEQ
ncbi:hypothetical protein BH23BAC3_BH23BAC3_24100 [soil metagenome]